VTLTLREVLGSSFELGRQFQTATKSQRFPTPPAKASNIESLCEMMTRDGSEDSDGEFGMSLEFMSQECPILK